MHEHKIWWIESLTREPNNAKRDGARRVYNALCIRSKQHNFQFSYAYKAIVRLYFVVQSGTVNYSIQHNCADMTIKQHLFPTVRR